MKTTPKTLQQIVAPLNLGPHELANRLECSPHGTRMLLRGERRMQMRTARQWSARLAPEVRIEAVDLMAASRRTWLAWLNQQADAERVPSPRRRRATRRATIAS